jgi:hypothetical protein
VRSGGGKRVSEASARMAALSYVRPGGAELEEVVGDEMREYGWIFACGGGEELFFKRAEIVCEGHERILLRDLSPGLR